MSEIFYYQDKLMCRRQDALDVFASRYLYTGDDEGVILKRKKQDHFMIDNARRTLALITPWWNPKQD